MRINPQTHPALHAMRAARPPEPSLQAGAAGNNNGAGNDNAEVREAFESFVGETLFGQMLQSMRKTVGKSAYFNGGRAEEIFTQQLDQVLAEKMADTCSESFTGPMFELFMMPRQ